MAQRGALDLELDAIRARLDALEARRQPRVKAEAEPQPKAEPVAPEAVK